MQTLQNLSVSMRLLSFLVTSKVRRTDTNRHRLLLEEVVYHFIIFVNSKIKPMAIKEIAELSLKMRLLQLHQLPLYKTHHQIFQHWICKNSRNPNFFCKMYWHEAFERNEKFIWSNIFNLEISARRCLCTL